jgi:nucleoid-associated protein YgaU
MRRLGQWVRALLSLVGMAVVLGGTPVALIAWVGNPIPPEGLALNAALTDGALIGLLAVLVWVIWAQLLIGTVAAIIEEIRGVDLASLPGVLGSQRDLARRAVAALAVVVVSSTAAASTASAAIGSQPSTATYIGGAHAERRSESEAPQERRDDLRLATVTHQQSDLWTIAERHLGDGQRWTEIRELNQGRIMVDGRTFRSANLLQPGWTLLMPPDAMNLPLASESEPTTLRAATTPYIVQPGDSLSTIAERLLGDPNRYGEIFELNEGRTQPDGGQLTDPDQIWPGWSLEVPQPDRAEAQAPEGRDADRDGPGPDDPPRLQTENELPRSQTENEPPRPQADPGPPADSPAAQPQDTEPRPESEPAAPPKGAEPSPPPERNEPVPSGAVESIEPPAAEQAEPVAAESSDSASSTTEDETGVSMVAVAGVGAVVAAGLVGLLRLRRTWQRARRKPGQRVPEADAAAVALEESLSSGADIAGVDLVDSALRGLLAWCGTGGNDGVLPVIQFARLTEVGVELYLAEPAQLPDPWTSLRGETAWSLARDAEGFAVFNDGGMAPYPALVYLGNDDEDGVVLVDLEYLGTLDLQGPSEHTERMLAALTAGLATSQWADHVDVTIVGTHPGLERELRTGRVRYLPEVGDLLSDLAIRAREDAAAWSELEVGDVTEARVQKQSEAAGLVVPEIVLLAVEVTPEQREQLASLLENLPRVAVAAVSTESGVGQWRLRPATDGVDTDDDGGDADHGDDGRTWVLDPVGLRLDPSRLDDETYARILDLLRAADKEPEGEPIPLAEPVATLDAQSPPSRSTPALHPAPVPTAGEVDSSWDDAPGTGADEPVAARETFGLSCPPVIDNLGPPRVIYPAVEIPENRMPRVLAFLCYIAENRGCSHQQLDEAMFPGARVNPDTRTRYINYARTLLGKGDNGMDYLPRRNYTDLSPEVVTTWDLFHNLVGDDPFTASTDNLERAMRLVRGRPYEGGKAAWYGWSEHSARRMYDLIADTACALADRRYSAGQWRAAVDAAVVGWSIEPVQQWLWRVHIQGLRALGDIDEARRIAIERNAFSEELEFELEPETARIFDELGIFDSHSYAH